MRLHAMNVSSVARAPQDFGPFACTTSSKHTYGHRLRVAGVSFEDRKLLLGHRAQHVTTHYSAPEISALIEASERVCQLESLASPALSVVRPHAGRLR